MKINAYDEYVAGVGKHEYQTIKNGLDYSGQDNVRYATITNGKLERINQSMCFSHFIRYSPTPASYESILIQIHDEIGRLYAEMGDKEYHTYYEWLFNHSSLKDAFLNKDVSKIMKDKVAVFDPNQDSRIVINAMFATRMAWECYSGTDHLIASKIKIWNDIVDMGVHPNIAFALSAGMIKRPDGYKVGTTNNHEFMDTYEIRHLNFSSSSLQLCGKTFNQIGGYYDVSGLWNRPRDDGFSLREFISDRWGKVKKTNNPFAAPTQGAAILNRDRFLSTLKEITTDYTNKLKELNINVT